MRVELVQELDCELLDLLRVRDEDAVPEAVDALEFVGVGLHAEVVGGILKRRYKFNVGILF